MINNSKIKLFYQQIITSFYWLLMILICLIISIVTDRYILHSGRLPLLREIIIYIHALLFMIGIVLCALHNKHSRIDITYLLLSKRAQLWIECLGHIILLLPLCIFLLYTSLPFVEQSWRIAEGSAEPGGLDYVYILKTLIPLQAILLGLTSISALIKSASKLTQIKC